MKRRELAKNSLLDTIKHRELRFSYIVCSDQCTDDNLKCKLATFLHLFLFLNAKTFNLQLQFFCFSFVIIVLEEYRFNNQMNNQNRKKSLEFLCQRSLFFQDSLPLQNNLKQTQNNYKKKIFCCWFSSFLYVCYFFPLFCFLSICLCVYMCQRVLI